MLAVQLFLGPKTIEAHLGRAYRKLGVRNHSQLAATIAREEGSPHSVHRSAPSAETAGDSKSIAVRVKQVARSGARAPGRSFAGAVCRLIEGVLPGKVCGVLPILVWKDLRCPF